MDIKDKIVVITGAGNGIGAAMARRFSQGGASALVLCDLDAAAAQRTAQAIDLPSEYAIGTGCDVALREDVERVVQLALDRHGRIDLFCSNAGIIVSGSESSPIADWQRAWDVNVMAHVHAAQAVLPAMLERGEGYLLNTISAAGLLTSLGAAPYAVSKHAALAFSEWLAITYGAAGIGVSALCPQVVRTKMIEEAIATGSGSAVLSGGEMIDADAVAQMVVDGLAQERFLLLTHPETQKYVEAKAQNLDRWIAGMQKFAARN